MRKISEERATYQKILNPTKQRHRRILIGDTIVTRVGTRNVKQACAERISYQLFD